MGTINKIKNTGSEKTRKECFQPLQLLTRDDYLVSSILSILTFVVYAFTAAPGVTLADSGDYIMGVLTLGIVHPPGYPLYTVLGHLFSLLPFGEPAFRVNLFSALWGSLCLGLVFLILRTLSIDGTHAVFATLFLGFTTVFWSKTGVAEVYSFNGFLIACIFFWILAYNRDKKRSRLYLIFLTTGLALSNHYPLVILSGVGLVFLLDRRDIQIADYLKGLLFLGLGLTPYLYLFIQALNPGLQYNFGKISDFTMVIDHILRDSYSNRYGGTVWDKFILAFTFLKATITNFLFWQCVPFLWRRFQFSTPMEIPLSYLDSSTFAVSRLNCNSDIWKRSEFCGQSFGFLASHVSLPYRLCGPRPKSTPNPIREKQGNPSLCTSYPVRDSGWV